MTKRDDDWDLIDPFKFVIGCFNFMFGLVKMLYSGLTSQDRFVRVVTVVFILFVVLSTGSYFQMRNLEMLCRSVLKFLYPYTEP